MEKRVLVDLKFGPQVKYEGHSPDNRAWNEYNKKLRYALGYVVDKYARNHAWTVITGKWDFEKNGIQYQLLVDQNKSKDVFASCDDVCKEFGWKSLKINDTHSTVFPNELSWEEKEALIAPKLAKGRKHMKEIEKKLKEAKSNGEEASKKEQPSFDPAGL